MDAIIYNTDVKDMIVSTVNQYGWESAKALTLCFWTTYCYVTDISPDTSDYDNVLFAIWTELCKLENFNLSFDDFNMLMCQNLV